MRKKDHPLNSENGCKVIICLMIFFVLFLAEFITYRVLTYETNVIRTHSTHQQLRINFNITLLDLSCEFVTIDVKDITGTRRKNVTENIHKSHLGASEMRTNYFGGNHEKNDEFDDTPRVYAVPIDQSNFGEWIKVHKYTFVNFATPWSIWCQKLEPIWEAFAKHVEAEQIPVSIVKVDCDANRDLCVSHKVQAYPTLRLFKDGEGQPPDYRFDRTVKALTDFIKSTIIPDTPALHPAQKDRKTDYSGCMVSGFLIVKRVPGNFHIEARSDLHNANPLLANLSHTVNHLSFVPFPVNSAINDHIPNDYIALSSPYPMKNRFYINDDHQAFHHHFKIDPTAVEVGGTHSVRNPSKKIPVVQTTKLIQYSEHDIPEARFSYDISAV